MRALYILFFCATCGLISCNGGTAATTATQTTVKKTILPVHSKLDDNGTVLLMNVVNQYYMLKNALVASKAPRADSASLLLVTAGDSLRAFVANDTSLQAGIKPYIDTIINYSKTIKGIDDASCERQRLIFGTVSSALYGLLKNVDIKNAGIYHEYCPMAFNEKGAYWLSEEAEIKNPYFGKKMLECGEVTDTLK